MVYIVKYSIFYFFPNVFFNSSQQYNRFITKKVLLMKILKEPL